MNIFIFIFIIFILIIIIIIIIIIVIMIMEVLPAAPLPLVGPTPLVGSLVWWGVMEEEVQVGRVMGVDEACVHPPPSSRRPKFCQGSSPLSKFFNFSWPVAFPTRTPITSLPSPLCL